MHKHVYYVYMMRMYNSIKDGWSPPVRRRTKRILIDNKSTSHLPPPNHLVVVVVVFVTRKTTQHCAPGERVVKRKKMDLKVPQSRLQNQYAYIELSPRPCVDTDDVVLSHWSNNENSEEQEDLREEECDESFTL